MRSLPPLRLISLTEAFNRIGAAYIDGWDWSERAVASLGQRSRGSFQAWKRAHETKRLMEQLVRDGRLGLVAYNGFGGRVRYFEGSVEEISMLLLPPDGSSSGLIEMQSGTVMECEIDISSLKLPATRPIRSGRKPKYSRFRELAEAAIDELGIHAPSVDVRVHISSLGGSDPIPRKSTANEIIRGARERVRSRWGQPSISGQLPVGRL